MVLRFVVGMPVIKKMKNPAASQLLPGRVAAVFAVLCKQEHVQKDEQFVLTKAQI